jgi:RNA polymerase sigma-70 factor, ECF subfamily
MNEHSERYFELILVILKDLEKFCIYMTRDKELAKDLLNDSIIEGHKSFKNLKSEKAFLSFMFTIISRIYNKNLRKKNNTLKLNFNELENLYSNVLPPDDILEIKMLYTLIDSLPENDKMLIVLSELMELKHKEIAEILNTSITNIKVGVFRAKKKLEKLFNESSGYNLNKNELINFDKFENFIKIANDQQN